MGLFDKLGGNKDIKLTPQAGLLLSAITMVAIDGDIDDDEVAIIRRLDRNGKARDWETAVKAWKTQPLEKCISLAAEAMNGEQQRSAIANLIDIAMADGILAGEERQLLESYVAAFEVDGAEIETIVAVIAVKNNQAIFE